MTKNNTVYTRWNIFDRVVDPWMAALVKGEAEPINACRGKTTRYIFLKKYQNMVKKGKLLAIEEITTEEKRYYWDQTKPLTHDKDIRIQAAKVIYLIDAIAANYIIEDINGRAAH